MSLFYSINKNHALENGNKRMSILVLAYFCAKNGRVLDVTDDIIYSLAKKTAESDDEEAAKRYIRKILTTHIST